MTEPMLDEICRMARDAGDVIMPYFRDADLKAETKADRSQVTAADHAAEALIVEALARMAPDIPIVAEELMAAGQCPDVSGGRFWLVDPLDGTKEFISKRPEFTVNIALIEDGKPVIGVVYVPAADTLYAGGRLGTAFREVGDGEREPISVRPIDSNAIVVALSRTYGASTQLTHFLEEYRVQRQVQSGSSIKFCLVACGEADVYPRYGGSSEWDTAAGHAVLTAAGGSVRVVDTDVELQYGKPRFSNPNFIAWGGRHQ